MNAQQLIGWISSAILLLTIATQITRQWKSGSSKGVSRWLFIGQMAASGGFILYSWLVRDWVFIVTNSLMLFSAAIGFFIVLWHRKSNPDESRDSE